MAAVAAAAYNSRRGRELQAEGAARPLVSWGSERAARLV
jgi:hypothetical protein